MLTFYYFISRGFTQLITLPIWWYGDGLVIFVKHLLERERVELQRLAVGAWLRNFFVPMFQDYTIIGRGLSMVFRTFITSFKIAQLFLGLLVRLLMLVVWILAPLFFVWGIINYFG